MKVAHWTDRITAITMPVEDVIAYDIAATDEEGGKLDTVEVQIMKLSAIVSRLVALLPEDEARDIVACCCHYHKPVSNDNG